MIAFKCPTCREGFSVEEGSPGTIPKCPRCGREAAAPPAPVVRDGRADVPTFALLGDPDATQGTVAAPATAAPHAGLTYFLTPPQAADELGRLGKYRVLAILGHGGMGVVFKAEDPKLKRRVAIKAMLPALAASAASGLRFMREAQAIAAVTHDHVVRVYQVDEEGGVPFLAMELLEGEPLDKRLEREGRLPLPEVLRIGREVAGGLAAAHATGLIHRDVKPANVWLEAPSDRVKILDFGLARAGSPGGVQPDAADKTEVIGASPAPAGTDCGLTQEGAVIGTPAYMAPEQAGGAAVDVRCDLFALGCVLYLACTGKQPFQRADVLSTLAAVASHHPPPPARLNPAIPPGLSALVMQLLEKDPARRPGSASHVATCLRGLQAKLARRGPRTWAALAGAAVLLAVLVGAGAFALSRLWGGPGGPAQPAAAPPELQVLEFASRMKALNPGFDGTVEHKIEDGAVTELRFVTDKVTDVLPLKAFDRLRVLDCRGTFTNWLHGNGQLADLSPLKGMDLTHLTRIDLGSTKVGDEGLALLKDCKRLTDIRLERTQVTDAGLAHFSGRTDLTALGLGGTQVTNAGLAHFSGCKGLTLLNLSSTQVTDAGLAHFSGCKDLTLLGLQSLHAVTDAGLVHFKDCKGLKSLELGGTGVTAAGLAHFSGCKKLTFLQLPSAVRDLSPLKGMPLKELHADIVLERDGEALRSINTLVTINNKPANEFYVSAFVDRMKALNLGFDGRVDTRSRAVPSRSFTSVRTTSRTSLRSAPSAPCASSAAVGRRALGSWRTWRR